MKTYGWCHNGYHNRPATDVIRRGRLARLDGLIIKYGDPAFERAITAAGIPWGVERFAYAAQPDREADMLADAVDAGASWAVANCEPNDGGGWDSPNAARAIRTLIDAFRARHPRTPLWICADLRPGRSLDHPFIREAARIRPGASAPDITGWMPMVYPKAFGQSVQRAFDAAFPGKAPVPAQTTPASSAVALAPAPQGSSHLSHPTSHVSAAGATYLGLPLAPVLQAYDAIGPAAVTQQLAEAHRRGARTASIYLVETASDEELRAIAARPTASPQPAPPPPAPTPPPNPTPGPQPPITPELLQATHHAYLRGVIAILDHGTPGELRAWAQLFGGGDK